MSRLSTLIVVDGSNLYNDASRHLIATFPGADPALRKQYFLTWFDVDRLIGATLRPHRALLDYEGSGLGTIILHSRKGLGEIKAGGLSGNDEIFAFWGRQGSAKATSTLLVDLAGAPSGKEVGVDTSIVVHLFETIASWEAAVLFTNDADLAPAVWSLRRRGKRVYCASPADPEEDASRPLIQASQDFLRWDLTFLTADWAVFEFLQAGGPLDKFLGHGVGPRVKLIGRGRPGDFEYSQILLWPQSDDRAVVEEAVRQLEPLMPPGFSVSHENFHKVVISLPEASAGWVLEGMDRHATRALPGAEWLLRWQRTAKR